MIGAFRSSFFVSVFQVSLLVIALYRAIVDQFSSNIFLIFLILILESFSVLFLRAKLGECVAL